MNWTKDDFSIDTDKNLLDIQVICGFLKSSYWGSSRTREQIQTSIDLSICFGVYHEEKQVGFARLITDEVVISWLGDVFIIPEYQKRGLGKWLMECITSHPVLNTTKCLLETKDAHGLYKPYGWDRKEVMIRPVNNSNK